MYKRIIAISFLMLFGCQALCHADLSLMSLKVTTAPVIDGNGQDPVWRQAKEIITHDNVANLNISIKSIHTNENIFFLVRFDDPDESILHKPWHWNKGDEIYDIGPEREDGFVFKWAMDNTVSDLSLHADQPYIADIWFWKANRTNPAGYADDKIQRLSLTKMPKSMQLKSKTGTPMFLRRQGDRGRSAYQSKLFVDYAGDTIPQFTQQNPSGSRADVQAKGVWANNEWTIEFSRSLTTDNDDDLQFDLSQTYLFGVSRYEVAGRKPDPKLSQPLYGSGDVTDNLFLIFSKP